MSHSQYPTAPPRRQSWRRIIATASPTPPPIATSATTARPCSPLRRSAARRAQLAAASVPRIVASAAAAGSSVSSALREPGNNPSHIGTPITTTAVTLTALVSTNSSTERLAIRSTEIPLLRSTQAPNAIPPNPLADTTELTASSASDRRRGQTPAQPLEHEPEQHHE